MQKDRGIFFRQNPRGSQLYQGQRGDWWIRYVDQYGQLHREKVGPKSLAKEVYRKRKTAIREGKFFPDTLSRKREVLFEEAAKDYVAYCQRHKRSWRRYAHAMTHCLARFTGKTLNHITPKEVEAYRDDRLQVVKPATVARELAALQNLYSRAVRDGKAASNPVKAITMPKVNNARTRYLTEDEEARLLAALSERHRLAVMFALDTGLRFSEQLGLQWQDVDFKAEVLTIRQSKHGEARHVPLNSRALATLRTIRQGQVAEARRRHAGEREILSPYVFCTGTGAPYQSLRGLRRRFQQACREAGLTDLRWHDLRHTFASRLVMAGVDLYTVKDLLGHKTLKMTARYAHLSPSHQRQAVERLVAKATGTGTDTGNVGRETAPLFLDS